MAQGSETYAASLPSTETSVIIRLFLRFRPWLFASSQTDFPEDGGGQLKVLGSFRSIYHVTVDIDRLFHRAISEPTDPERWGLTHAGALKTSDVLTFVVPASEVSAKLIDQTFVSSSNLFHSHSNKGFKPGCNRETMNVWSDQYEDRFEA